MGHFLIAAALAATVTPTVREAPSALPDAKPAIWVVNDHDTVIYLFGTFHALDGKADWFNDEIETAFAASDELVLETIIPDFTRPAPVKPSAKRPVGGLSFAPSASFLASTRMAISAGRARGMKADMGADSVLRRAAEASGKPVTGLESFASQMNMFGRMPAKNDLPEQFRIALLIMPAEIGRIIGRHFIVMAEYIIDQDLICEQ